MVKSTPKIPLLPTCYGGSGTRKKKDRFRGAWGCDGGKEGFARRSINARGDPRGTETFANIGNLAHKGGIKGERMQLDRKGCDLEKGSVAGGVTSGEKNPWEAAKGKRGGTSS